MTRNQLTKIPVPRAALLGATALAILTALVHFSIGLGMVPDGFESPPPALMMLAGFTYPIGGVLILFADGRLLLVGAVVNMVVLVSFVLSAAAGNGTVDTLSLTGKITQVALEVLLIWCVAQMPQARRRRTSVSPAA